MRNGASHVVFAVVLGLVGGVADADPKKAKALNVEGMKKYNKKRYYEAFELFKKAIVEDPSYVWPHYNAASMASLLDEFETAIKELEWVAASKDPIAVQAMKRAKTDKDLEKAIMHPRVRELVGLTPLDKLTPEQILLERTGVWGSDGGACGIPAFTITFKSGGTATLQVEAGCNDHHSKEKSTGTWKLTNDKIIVTFKRKGVGLDSGQATFGPCDAKDTNRGWCLNMLEGDDGSGNEYNFGRGAADLM